MSACGGPATPDGDGGTGDGGTGDGGGELSVERWGARLVGPVLGLTRAGRSLWIGTGQAPIPGDEERFRAQLARLDLDTGEVRVFEDELPTVLVPGSHSDVAPVATADVVVDGARTLVLAQTGILTFDGEAFEEHRIEVTPGVVAVPTSFALDGPRSALWVATDRGLVRLNAQTFAIEARLASDMLGAESIAQLALDASGAVYAITRPDAGGSRAVRVIDGALDATLVPGEAGVPEGLFMDVVIDPTSQAAYFAMASWDPTSGGVVRWEGGEVEHVVSEHALSVAARGESRAFGAAVLALDATDRVLLVGGQMRPTGPGSSPVGGGLAWIDLSAPTPTVAGTSTETSSIAGDHVRALAWDPDTNRTFAALMHPCSESRLGNAGLTSIRFDGDQPVFEKPILSGVRDLEILDGRVHAAIRDDVGGLRCEGVEVQGGLVELTQRRSGVQVPLHASGGEYEEPAFYDTNRTMPTELAYSGANRIVAGWRDALYVGPEDGGRLLNPALELGVSLYVLDVAWEDERTYWVAGRATHSPGDGPELADVGPHGAARVRLDAEGRLQSRTLFVRAVRDAREGTVTGLPSSEVTAVVPIPGGGAYLVCGTERVWVSAHDRMEGEPFAVDGVVRRGGVAHVTADGTVSVLASGEVVPDGRAGALDAAGVLHVLDAERGLLRWNGTAFEAIALTVPEGSLPRALWLGDGGDLVAAYSSGALVRLGGAATFVEGVGHAWTVAERAAGVVWIGTDEGLVRVRRANAVAPAERQVALGALPPYRAVSTDPGEEPGECLGVGQICGDDPDGCCPGLECAGSGLVVECVLR